MRTSTLIATAVMLLPGASGAQAQATVRRDSAGVEIIHSRRPAWAAGRAWQVEQQPFLQIGRVDGQQPYLFAMITDARAIGDSLIAVVDQHEIRLFRRSGEYVRTIGRQGKGPGEFASAPTLAFAEPDQLVAWDSFNRRVTWFSMEGEVRREVTLSAPEIAKSLNPAMSPDAWQILPDGTIASLLAWPDRPDPAAPDFAPFASTRRIVFVHASDQTLVPFGAFTAGTGLRFQAPADGRPARRSIRNPFAPARPAALHPRTGGLVIAGPERWELSEYRADASLRAILRADIPRTPVTRSLIRHEREPLAAMAQQLQTPVALLERAFDSLEFPDSAPAIARVLVDPEGNLWLQRWQSETSGSPPSFDVLAPGGEWLATLHLTFQPGFITHIASDHITTIWRDESDVAFVRLHRIRK